MDYSYSCLFQSWGMCGTDMKGEWERKGYTFQFSRTDTMMIPKLQYRSPFTNKDDNYVFAQVISGLYKKAELFA